MKDLIDVVYPTEIWEDPTDLGTNPRGLAIRSVKTLLSWVLIQGVWLLDLGRPH